MHLDHLYLLGFHRYDHTDTDMPITHHINAEDLRRNNVARFLFGDEETHLFYAFYFERPIFKYKILFIHPS